VVWRFQKVQGLMPPKLGKRKEPLARNRSDASVKLRNFNPSVLILYTCKVLRESSFEYRRKSQLHVEFSAKGV
jgi:hypothetical protein